MSKRALDSTQTPGRPRKRLINNRRVPLKITSPENHALRSVYIVARPVTKAGYFKPLSEGKLPFCHWALLVSEHNQSELQKHLISQSEAPSTSPKHSWGALYEITKGDGVMVLMTNENFGRKFGDDWQYALIAYVGETSLEDGLIYDHGKNFILQRLILY